MTPPRCRRRRAPGRALVVACFSLALPWAARAQGAAAGPPVVPRPAAAAYVPAGPDGRSELPAAVPADLARHQQGGPQALALYVTDRGSAWLSVVRGFEAAGIPVVATADWREAVAHRVVLAYPLVSGRAIPGEGLKALAAHVREGGTLIASELLGGGLEPVFGVDSARPGTRRRTLAFTDSAAAAWGLAHARERTIPVGAREARRPGLAVIGTIGYAAPAAQVLARFDDGSAAITHRAVGEGHAWIVGVDLGAMLHLGYDNREDGLARSYVNQFEPTLDVLLGVVTRAWRTGEPAAVALGTVPWGKSLALAFTHDVDYSRDWPHALDFARALSARGVSGTFFVQAKYVKDYNDDVFFDRVALRTIAQLDTLRMEVASHSVAHAPTFRDFALGTGTERFPDYRPFVKSPTLTWGATVLGELRVSRWLLEQATGRPGSVRAFRPGKLANPFALPQALEATGFRYASTVTANNALTHRPFRLSRDRAGAAEGTVWEFPVTIEDEEQPAMLERLDRAVALAGDIARWRGTMVVLTHPTESTGKLRFTEGLLAALADRAHVSPVSALGDWWVARTATRVEARVAGDTATVTLAPPSPVEGLALEVPDGWALVPAPGVTQAGTTVVVARAEGTQALRFRVSRTH
jgi:peptidoglycan/xylan/chitin deacetylase (PgdA/CDA1 family)